MQHVEPAAGLADVLDDEVRRVVGVEPFLVLERVVDLAVGHGAGVEPDVQDVLDAAHHGLALLRGAGVVRVRAGQLVDERPVQVHLAGLVQRQAAEVGLDLGERAVDVGARVVRVAGLPHRDGAAPVAVAADGPVAGVGEPLAELAVLDVARDPVDLLVELGHAVLELGDLDVPGGHGAVDQRVAAAPAVRVAVLVAGLADQAALGAEHLGDGLVGLEDLQAGDLGEVAVAEQRQELGALVHGEDHGDAGLFTDLLVVFTVGGRLVDDAGAVGGGDVVGHEEAPGVLGAVLLGVGEVVPERLVAQAVELGAGVAWR